MDRYPKVVGEMMTLDLVLAGASIARYGDGEFKMCRGAGIKSQEAHPDLRRRLNAILEKSGDCLVGIPNIRSDTPKAAFWGGQMHNCRLLTEGRRYVSSFITRPDSAPWLDVPEYWEKLESLWKNQDVTLVRGSGKSFCAEDLKSARTVTEILTPRQHAFAQYDELLERIGTPARAILCVGPTATVMAVDLCAKGVHAIDAGHLGMFFRKHLRGDPMWVTQHDRVALV
jgi:hypothetical protein